jgi:hypothetical protein
MTPTSILAVSLLAVAPTALAPLPSPAPTPAAPAKQLKVIGRVRATVCGSIVVHANSAITSTLHNDATLQQAVLRLRGANLEGNPMDYHRGVTDLEAYATQMHDDAVHGNGEVQRLRDLAKTATDPARKADLEAFADAIGGALNRQKQVSADLTGFVAYLQARDMRATPEIDRAIATDHMDPPLVRGQVAIEPSPFQLWTDIHGSPGEMAHRAADDFSQRAHDIARDEGVAADHAEGAVTGCNSASDQSP